VELVLLSAADLGFKSQSSLADVYKRARKVGLELCPAEVGPQLRLDYRNQPRGEALHIAMQPLATYSGEPTILALANFAPSGLLEALRGPQIVPTSSEQKVPERR
jgi:hypothetical protein